MSPQLSAPRTREPPVDRQRGDPTQDTCSAGTSRGQHQGVGVGEVGVRSGQQRGPAESSLSPRSRAWGVLGPAWGPPGRGRGRGLSSGPARQERSGWPHSGRVPRPGRVGAWGANPDSSRRGLGAGGLAASGAGTWRPGPRAGPSSAPPSSGVSSPQPPLSLASGISSWACSLWEGGGRAAPGTAARAPGSLRPAGKEDTRC